MEGVGIKNKEDTRKELKKEYEEMQKKYSQKYLDNLYFNFLEFKNISEKELKKEEKILKALRELSRFSIISCFDYIRVRVPILHDFIDDEQITEDIEELINFIFKGANIRMSDFTFSEKGLYGYTSTYSYGRIKFFVSDLNRINELGLLIELSGLACRELEILFLNNNYKIRDFLTQLIELNASFTRIDLALDDTEQIFNIAEIFDDVKKNRLSSSMKVIRPIENMYYNAEKKSYVSQVSTIYFGSMKSNLHFCFYDKNIEQKLKNNNEEVVGFGNRFELRFKDDLANDVINSYLRGTSINSIICYFLSEKINYDEYCLNRTLFKMLFDYLKREDVTITKEVKTLYDEKMDWLISGVSCALNMVIYIDSIKNNFNLKKLLDMTKSSYATDFRRILDNYRLNDNSINCLVNYLGIPKKEIIKDLEEKGFLIDEKHKI